MRPDSASVPRQPRSRVSNRVLFDWVALSLALMLGVGAAGADVGGGGKVTGDPVAAGYPQLDAVPEGVATTAPLVDLPAVLRTAWTREPRILEAINLASAAGYDIDAAQVGFFPFAAVTSSQGEEGGLNTTLRVVQPLWNGGRTRAEVSAARSGERAANAEVDQAKLEVGREVIEAFFDLVAAETQVEQWNEHISALEKLVDIISRRAAEGVAPDADVQTAVSRVRQSEAQRESSRASASQRRAELEQLVNQPVGSVNWPTPDAVLAASMPDRNLAQVLDEHPSVQASIALQQQQQAETKRQRAALMPELQLQYRVDVEGVRNNQADGFLLALEYETGNGLRGYQNARAQHERGRAAQHRVEAARRQVIADLNVARSKVTSAIAQRRAQAAAVAATDHLLDSFLRQFEVGRKSWVEVLNASREANETVQQAILAERDFWKANARLALDSMAWGLLVAEYNVIQPEQEADAGPASDSGADIESPVQPMPTEAEQTEAVVEADAETDADQGIEAP